MKSLKKFKNISAKTYFIADIGANHDGSLSRAKKLIKLCAKAGADAAKFQHFKADTIVSSHGFKLVKGTSHQSKWKKSVYETYKDASINLKWTKELYKECKKQKIDFLTSPYDLDYVDKVNQYISAYKIGSGDISWHQIIEKIASKRKPCILATGASSIDEVKKAVSIIRKKNKNIILMQCNSNYTNSENNFKYINLNVLNQYKKIFKTKIILGLSDHTEGHSTVLGAVTLGAKVIEKHFTDDNKRNGPDHKFAMNYKTWMSMVLETRRLEKALGDGVKKIEKNEKVTSIVQKRGLYATKQIEKGERFTRKNITPLRPNLKNNLPANLFNWVINRKAKNKIKKGECLKRNQVI